MWKWLAAGVAEIADGADLCGLTSVVIWCDRCHVAFGTAPVDL